MGPKKNKGTKGKAKGGGADEPPLGEVNQKRMNELIVTSLQQQLSERSEEASKEVALKREIQDKVDMMKEAFENSQKQVYEIKQDMTRQFTSLQEDLLNKINKLQAANGDLRDLLDEADVKREKALKDKDVIINAKNDEIKELNKRIDSLSIEFSDMLQETLQKMKETIIVSTENGTMDVPEASSIHHKIEELKVE